MKGAKGVASGPKRSRTPLHSLRKKCRALDTQKLQRARLKQLYRVLKKAKQFEIRKIKRRLKDGPDAEKLQRQLDIAKTLDLAVLTNELAAEAGWEARMPVAGVKGGQASSTERSAAEQTVHDRVKKARIVQDELKVAFELLAKATGQPLPAVKQSTDATDPPEAALYSAGTLAVLESEADSGAASKVDLAAADLAIDERLVGAAVLAESSSDGEEAAAPLEALEALRRTSSAGQQVDDDSCMSSADSHVSEDRDRSAEPGPGSNCQRHGRHARGDSAAAVVDLLDRWKRRHDGAHTASNQQSQVSKPSKRLGQRARRKLYERQYGSDANHLRHAPKAQPPAAHAQDRAPTDPDADAAQAHPSWAAKQAQKRLLAAAPRGKKVVFDDGPDGSARPFPALGVTSRALVSKSSAEAAVPPQERASVRPLPGRKAKPEKVPDKQANLHPSWLAAKRRQEEQAKQSALLAKPLGTKVVFAD